MKLNLGCGRDIRAGYTNVDARDLHQACDLVPGSIFVPCDLSRFPWWWSDGVADEILMLDFLEHFPMAMTPKILAECFRVLKPSGELVIQVPDADTVMSAIVQAAVCSCTCGKLVGFEASACDHCGRTPKVIAEDARHRLFGGQDYPGNFHQTCFTASMLFDETSRAGFFILTNEQNLAGDHWNMRFRFRKPA